MKTRGASAGGRSLQRAWRARLGGRPAAACATREAMRIGLALRLFALLLLALLLLALATGASRAHVVLGEKSLQQHVAEAETIVVARVRDPQARYRSPDGRLVRPVIEVVVEQTLKGRLTQSPLRIAQHGHGVATYREDERALFFLDPIGQRRELLALVAPGGPTHVSSQEHDEAFVLDGPEGDRLLVAVRAYVEASDPALGADARLAILRRTTLQLLESRSPRLGASALASLVAGPSIPLLRAEDLPRLDALLSDGSRPAGFRAGLLAELERRGLVVDVSARWSGLLATSPRDELAAMIRAVGPRAGDGIETRLIALVGDADERIAAEAALALGRPGRSEAVPALERAVATRARRVRGAALRGLEAIGTPPARSALERIRDAHPDPATRRRARAALEARRGPSDPQARSDPGRDQPTALAQE